MLPWDKTVSTGTLVFAFLRRTARHCVPLLVLLGIIALVARAARSPLRPEPVVSTGFDQADIAQTVEAVNQSFYQRWEAAGLPGAPPAPQLQVLRRLSLALHGASPSLEEVRQFEADNAPDRLGRWTQRFLADSRFADYFSERLARGYVGTDAGQFVVFRRDRFRRWLREELHRNTPYDVLVRQMVGSTGLWTGTPSTNFITAAVADENLDRNKLAGRVSRAFLGQRIDCAQCHDHPFERWKQHDFEGLAAYFGQVQHSIVGVEDKQQRDGKPVEFTVQDRETLKDRIVEPAVPYHAEWLPETGTRREQLAGWITHPEHHQFHRAIANRVWAIMFGRPLVDPVDELPESAGTAWLSADSAAQHQVPDVDSQASHVLDLLGRDFRDQGCDLKRLVYVIASCELFQLDSQFETTDSDEASAQAALERAESNWAVFPLIRLRPEQVIRSMLQSATLQTADQHSHWLFRAIRFFRENDFVKEYGDLGTDELQDRGGTIPQRLLLMNGEFAAEASKSTPFSAAGSISSLASNDVARVEAAYLTCLTRRPTLEELNHFEAQLADSSVPRESTMEDLIWSLFNSTEFSWNH